MALRQASITNYSVNLVVNYVLPQEAYDKGTM